MFYAFYLAFERSNAIVINVTNPLPNIEKLIDRVRGMDVDAGVSVDDGPATICINTIRSTSSF